MLSDADADVIIFDTTNPPFTFKKSYMALCEEYRKIRSEGNRTPQIAFLCPFWDPSVVIKTLYDDFYSKGTFKELWFQWKGKPLIMADPDKIADPEIKKFFTFRKPIPSYFTGPSAPGQWGWLEVYPQHAFRDEKNRIEQVTVGVAQNAVGSELSAMSHRDGAMGRSWHKGARDMSANAVAYGHNFAEQWSHALELDPEFVFITGWNEWVAGHFDKWYKYTGKDSYYPDAIFVDQYDHEYSRDVEPMKGGHMDSYYYQMVGSIRRFKGVPKAAAPSGSKAITIDGHFSDWKDVLPEYRDTIGDTARRDHKGYGETRYVDNSGRNDFVVSKVAYDETNIYFYVKTRDNITPHSDKNWMLLFIDSDHNHATGWEGYDYVVNSHVTDSDETSLKKISEGKWLTVAHPAYRVNGKEMEIQISRSAVTQDVSNGIAFDFHWADNIQKHDIIEFAVSGDSAPNRRFSYRYESTGDNPD